LSSENKLAQIKQKIERLHQELATINQSTQPMPELINATNILRTNEYLTHVNEKKTEIVSSYEDSEFIKTESLDFCRKQKLHEAMLKSVTLLKSNSFDEISKIINNALKAGDEIDNGYDFLKDFEKTAT